MNISKWSELIPAIMAKAEEAILVANKEMEEIVKEEINKTVYSYSPSYYDRTYELRDSVTSKIAEVNPDGAIVSKVYHDDDAIHPYVYESESVFNQHASQNPSQDDVSNSIAYIVHEGRVGSIYQKGVLWRDSSNYKNHHDFAEPRPYMDNAREKIITKGLYVKEIKRALKASGVKTE